MNVGVAHSEQNPNVSWLNSKGIWFTYVIFVFTMHLVLLSLPFLTTAVAWTLTNVLHNVVSVMNNLFFSITKTELKLKFKGSFLLATRS